METISIQALTAMPSSILVSEIVDGSIDKMRPTTFVNIGLQNGVLLRTVLDSTTGQLTDTRTRFVPQRTSRRRISDLIRLRQIPWCSLSLFEESCNPGQPQRACALEQDVAQLSVARSTKLRSSHLRRSRPCLWFERWRSLP